MGHINYISAFLNQSYMWGFLNNIKYRYRFHPVPMACDVSTTGTRDTGVSWEKSWSVRSVVDVEVKPFNSSCCRPVKLLHFSWPCSFSSLSLFSCLSSDMLSSSLFNSLKDIWYSNSKSDSISDTAAQKIVASRLLGWWMLNGSVTLSLDVDELRILANRTCCSQAWIRSSVALRGGSENLSGSPNFLGTEELLWCLTFSCLLRLSCPVLFLSDSCLKQLRKSGDEALQLTNGMSKVLWKQCRISVKIYTSRRDTNLVKMAIRSLFLRHSAKLSTTDSSVRSTSIT